MWDLTFVVGFAIGLLFVPVLVHFEVIGRSSVVQQLLDDNQRLGRELSRLDSVHGRRAVITFTCLADLEPYNGHIEWIETHGVLVKRRDFMPIPACYPSPPAQVLYECWSTRNWIQST